MILNAAREQAKKIVDQAHKREVEIVDEARTHRLRRRQAHRRQLAAGRARRKRRAPATSCARTSATLAVAGASRLLQREIDPKAHADLIEQLAREIEGAKA